MTPVCKSEAVIHQTPDGLSGSTCSSINSEAKAACLIHTISGYYL